MRKTWILGLVALAGMALVMSQVLSQESEEKPVPKYVGASKCKMCHDSEKKGQQYTKWTEEPHSKAFETLANEESKKIAEEMGLGNPQEAPECLKCHVTAYDAPDELKEDSYKKEEGVQCEACHGPGSLYKSMQTMKDRQKSIENGLILPTKEVCLKCHNPESPTYEKFCYKCKVKRVIHLHPDHVEAWEKQWKELECDAECEEGGGEGCKCGGKESGSEGCECGKKESGSEDECGGCEK